MKKIVAIVLCVFSVGFLLISQNSFAEADKQEIGNFSSPAANDSYAMHGNVNIQLNIDKEVDSFFSKDENQIIAGRSTGCSTGCSVGCSSGCSTGCSTGCSSGCSSGCSVGCSTGCSVGCQY